jgi:probable rRNA maturation factor
VALKKAELSLWLTSDLQIRKLNKEWRGKDKATDVLSFPLVGEAELRALAKMKPVPEWELGDVVISLDTAKRQAAEHGVTLPEELDLLLVHGLLHLIGFDHEISPEEEKRMRRWEKKLLGGKGLI